MIKESKSLTQISEKLMRAAAEKGFAEDTSILVLRADSHTRAAAPIAAGAAAAASKCDLAGISVRRGSGGPDPPCPVHGVSLPVV